MYYIAIMVAISNGEECRSLLQPSCVALGDCTGLQCYSEELGQNITFVVDKCTDPIVINITITNATDDTAVILSQSFTETTDTGDIVVTMGRNAIYVHVKVQ